MQVVVATGAITSVICFGIGFVALACLPIFPKGTVNTFRTLLPYLVRQKPLPAIANRCSNGLKCA